MQCKISTIVECNKNNKCYGICASQDPTELARLVNSSTTADGYFPYFGLTVVRINKRERYYSQAIVCQQMWKDMANKLM